MIRLNFKPEQKKNPVIGIRSRSLISSWQCNLSDSAGEGVDQTRRSDRHDGSGV